MRRLSFFTIRVGDDDNYAGFFSLRKISRKSHRDLQCEVLTRKVKL